MSLSAYLQLEGRFKRILLFRGIGQVLRWDAEVAMPKGSAPVRGEQLAALDAECHALLTEGRTGRLLARAESVFHQLDDWQQANVRAMRRMWTHAAALPKSLVRALGKSTTEAEVAWRRAREENDFSILAPHFEKVLGLIRQKAETLAARLDSSPYDALLDEYDPGCQAVEIDALFSHLEKQVPRLIQKALARQVGHAPRPLTEPVPLSRQKRLARLVMERLGFPFHQGRLDTSEHPFTEGPPGDIRLTTRYEKINVLSGFMGVLHETGHALYDFGLPPLWRHQPVGRDAGMSVHEGQALFWEMVIGRSRSFMNWAAPVMRRTLKVDGPEWEADNLYALATWVHPGAIRMDADELTYSVHVLLRYDLERSLLAGKLKLQDLPEAWNARMKQDLGLVPPTHAEGCLQDSHWPHGYFGYFSTYLLGALMAAQWRHALKSRNPEILAGLEEGRFQPVLAWLREQVHLWGARYSGQELLQRATGQGLQVKPYLQYLESKYLDTGAAASSAVPTSTTGRQKK